MNLFLLAECIHRRHRRELPPAYVHTLMDIDGQSSFTAKSVEFDSRGCILSTNTTVLGHCWVAQHFMDQGCSTIAKYPGTSGTNSSVVKIRES